MDPYAAIMGGGGAPAGPPPFGGFPGGPPGGDPTQAGDPNDPANVQGGSPLDHMRTVIEELKAYLNAEKDPQDLAAATDLLHKAQTILANDQKQKDQALGISPGVQMIRKQAANAGTGP